MLYRERDEWRRIGRWNEWGCTWRGNVALNRGR